MGLRGEGEMKTLAAPRVSIFLFLVLGLAVLAVPVSLSLVPPSPYPSRAACWGWHPVLVAMHDWGNAAMWIEYTLIPALLFWVGWQTRAWRVAQAFPVLAIEGCLFVFACGATHLFARTEVYSASPWASGVAVIVAVLFGFLFIVDLIRKSSDLVRWLDGLAEAAKLVEKLGKVDP